MTDTRAGRRRPPYVVLIGPPALTRAVAGQLPEHALHPARRGLRPGRGRPRARGGTQLGGLGARRHGDPRHAPGAVPGPGRARCPAVPVLAWSPFHQPRLLEAVLRDPQALVSPACPSPATSARPARCSALACRPEAAHAAGCPRARFAASRRRGRRGRGSTPWRQGGAGSTGSAGPLLPEPGRDRAAAQRPLALPWTLGGGHSRAARRRLFEDRSGWPLRLASTGSAAWRRRLRRAWDAAPAARRRPAPRAAVRARGGSPTAGSPPPERREPAPGASAGPQPAPAPVPEDAS